MGWLDEKNPKALEDWIEENEQLTGELLDAVDSGKLSDGEFGHLECRHMNALSHITRSMTNGRDLYLKLRKMVQEAAVSRLKKKSVINVAFMIHDSTVWIGDRLYKLFEQSERFEPYVYCLRRNVEKSYDVLKDEYPHLTAFFRDKGFRTVVSEGNGNQLNGINSPIPDICIWLTPWVYDFDDSFKMENFPLSTLHTYIPYGFNAAENKDGTYVDYDYNQDLHNILWKNFAKDRISLEDAPKYSYANTNGVYTGHPKMDGFFRMTRRERADGKKLVIYAPHHSMWDKDTLRFSTFEYNYRFMLELAKKYSDKVAWVFKPHPILKVKVMLKGLFKNAEEWNAYLDEWRSLPDAEVVEEGMYTQLFIDSDAMIFDSVSFMTEYIFADKPALFLTRPEQYFSRLGKMVKDVHYTADGKDFKAIEDFLCNVVLDGNDTKKDERHRFFEENLDYRKNGCLAAENIFNELCRELS